MNELKNKFAGYIDSHDNTVIDTAWQVLQNKLTAYTERRKNATLFQHEIYKWRLLSHYAGVVFDNAEKLNVWLQDKDNNLLSSRKFGSTYDGIIRGERNAPSFIKDGFQLFSSIDNYPLIRENPLFQWNNQKGEHETISDRDIATYLFLQNPLQYMPYSSNIFASTAKDIGLNNMTMPRWMEFGRFVILPLLAKKLNVFPGIDIDAIKAIDIEHDFTDIQAGKYLCMLDVQDFIYTTWCDSGTPGFRLWKLSQGSGFFSHEEHIAKLNANLMVMHPHTKAKARSNHTQAELFLEDNRQWDVVYICRGNHEVSLIALIAPSSPFPIDINGDNSWSARSIIPITFAPAGTSYTGNASAWWLPTDNSTFTEIKWKDKIRFEREILQPCFQLSLEDLLQERKLIMQHSKGDSFMNNMTDLLLSAHQIILTGAPGTGKTYMAKQLAYALSGDDEKNHPHVEFCQFHPSLDYSDFVEGLRPVSYASNNEIGFERKDGIFKSFCKKALKNYTDSQKTLQEIEVESSAEVKINDFLNDIVENRTQLQTTNGNAFFIKDFDDRRISVEIPENEKASKIIVPYQEIQKIIAENCALTKAGDIKDIFERQHNRQQDSYVYIICKEIRKRKKKQTVEVKNSIKLQNYIFIIDKINRGDISRIFGELFYAIDPGYRGNKGKITTQYANLLDDTDLYKDGFFVPENVYIIGTMNDIDRSVESMDFAIRRRFTWVEIKAADATDMWDQTIPDYKEDARGAMTRINTVISNIQGLGEAFHIGPAYFIKLADYKGDMRKLWTLHIMPLLKEYLRGMPSAEDTLAALQDAYFKQSEQATGE